jgi:hypothetical protein
LKDEEKIKVKKTLISMVAVAFVALMIANVYAPPTIPLPTIPPPTFCDGCPGFTPGFWKHNIKVRLSHEPYNLGLTNGAYSAFEGGPRDGEKLTDDLMDAGLAAVNAALGAMGVGPFTFGELLAFLEGPGWSPDRTNTANWFNKVAGYGPF